MKRRPFVSPISLHIKNLHLVNSFSQLFFFWLSSFIKSSCNESIFIDNSLSCQWWQQHEKTKKKLSNDSPSFSSSISTGRDNWKENLVNGVSISPHLSSQEKEKSSIEHTIGTQGNEKNYILIFIKYECKHIIIIIIFIIRLICLVHTSLYMDTVFTRIKELSKQTI